MVFRITNRLLLVALGASALMATPSAASDGKPFPRFAYPASIGVAALDLEPKPSIDTMISASIGQPPQVHDSARPPGSRWACQPIAAPPAMIDTVSKYDRSDASRSRIVSSAALARDNALRPIRKSIRQLGTLFDEVPEPRIAVDNRRCAAQILNDWAKAGVLTDMRSEDAFLTRDRFVSEIAIAIAALDKSDKSLLQMPEVRSWLKRIAQGTIDFYEWRAGPKSRRNNHRYWAGLSVGQIGFLLDDAPFIAWAGRSYDLGVCQVDADGFLPLELARGERALEYHLYALRPLAVFARLAGERGVDVKGSCAQGLRRLTERSANAVADPSAFATKTGFAQKTAVDETSFSAAFRLSSLSDL